MKFLKKTVTFTFFDLITKLHWLEN